jgi:hypothetical protein
VRGCVSSPLPQPRDFEIRFALRKRLKEIHADEPDTAIINELSLCQGNARIDLAVVNGSLSGYEIKSDRDTLGRLPGQESVYSLCFNNMTVVVGSRHVDECLKVVPFWWGIWEVLPTTNGIEFECRRAVQLNPQIAPDMVVQLLWKDEAREALRVFGSNPVGKATRRELWESLVSLASSDELLEIVRDRLRARGDWRSAPTPFRCGGLSRSAATAPRSQENRQWLLSAGSRRPLD